MKKTIAMLSALVSAVLFAAPGDGRATEAEAKEASALNWDAAPVDIILQAYGKEVGKTVLKDPGVPGATITLKGCEGQKLTKDEYLEVITVALEMNGIHLEPYGDKFIRAVARGKARKEGIPLYMDIADVPPSIKDGLVVSVMMPFKAIATEEAQKALEGLKSETGLLLVFERTNSILVTDTWQNIKRMNEIANAIDVATPVNENVFVRQIHNASAQDIQTHLQKIVEESMKELEKNGKGVQNAQNQPNRQPYTPNRVLGGRQPQPEAPKAVESMVTAISDADRGMIRGKVLILADERSNKLIVVTAEDNMKFFDQVIEQLDVETTPDVKVEVIRLKYADAEEVSDMINDLIGNASGSKNSTKSSQNPTSRTGSGANLTRGTASSAAGSGARNGESKAGELSKDNVTVLADKRINGLVIMARTVDMPVLHQIIESMDVKLAQVLIETCIIEVNLEDSIKTGIDWVHQISSHKGGLTQAVSGGGGSTSMGGALYNIATEGASAAAIPSGAGVNYMALSDKLNLGAVIEASKTDSRAKYLASPVIMTVDNKEATIEATQMRYLLTGFTSSGTSYSTIAVPNYAQKEIGITIKTTPKINPNGTVMLKIEEEYSQLGAPQSIKTNTGVTGSEGTSGGLMDVPVDTTITRKMSADIALENHQTVILGGLTETKTEQTETGIPLLKDIPWIGRYLFGSTKDTETRKELLVFMTPYVLDDADEAQAEAFRRKRTMSLSRPWDDHGWSESDLADPVSVKEQLRRQRAEWERQDQEYAAELEEEKAKGRRVKDLEKRAAERSIERAQKAKAIADAFNAAEEKRAEARAEAEVQAREGNELLKLLQEETEAGSAK